MTIVRVFRAMGHGAVWTGLYVAACAFCAIHTGTHRLPSDTWLAVLAAYLCGQGVYLLDRVKLRDAWLDEADRQAHPQRFAFIHRHRRSLRGLIVCEAIAAAGLLAMIHPALALLPPTALGGVVAYAGLPRTFWVPPGAGRIKDLLIVKNLAVASSITAFALVLAIVVAGDDAWRWAWWRWSWVGAFLLFHVLADSMLCDIDDVGADERFGTQTLAWRRSARFVRALAIGIALGLAVVTWANWILSIRTGVNTEQAGIGWVRVTWATMMLFFSGILWFVPTGSLRDAVDLRLPIAAVYLLALYP